MRRLHAKEKYRYENGDIITVKSPIYKNARLDIWGYNLKTESGAEFSRDVETVRELIESGKLKRVY